MAIKDKDGKVYQLRGPNPVMKTQDIWNPSNLVFHNMRFREVVHQDERITPQTIIEEYTTRAPLQEYIDRIQVDPVPTEEPVTNVAVLSPPKVEDPPPPSPPPVERPVEKKIPVDRRIARLLEERKVVFHCLPVITKKHTDELYGNVHTKRVYGEKFVFPGIVVQESDMMFQFWTDREVPEQSIVFPQMETKRWWKVVSHEPKSGGYLVSATVSEINPDFSD